MNKIDNYIKILSEISLQKNYKIVISLQNTVSSLSEKNQLYFLPIRKYRNYLFGGICNGNNNETRYFLNKAQDLSEFVLIDVEKKYPWMECDQGEKIYMGNIELLVDDLLDKKKVIFIWPNSMTVEACLGLINKYSKPLSLTKVAIVGVGNIGFKVALRLIEAGSKVSISSKNYENTLQFANFINRIKPKSTIAAPLPIRETHTCVSNQDCIFICTGGSLVLTKLVANSIQENTKIFSLSNLKISDEVREIFKKKNIEFRIIDITPYYFFEIIKHEISSTLPKPQRIKKEGYHLVSSGYQGQKLDIVVDDAENPLIVLGYIDSNGFFNRNLILWEEWIKSKDEYNHIN